MDGQDFKGNLHTTLGDIFKKYPEIPAMEVLYAIQHKSNFKGQHYLNMSEEDLYSSAERFLKYGESYTEDEMLTDQEWEEWRTNKFTV